MKGKTIVGIVVGAVLLLMLASDLFATMIGAFLWPLLPFIIIGGVIWLFRAARQGQRDSSANRRKQGLDTLLETFGQTKEERAKVINERFDKRSGSLTMTIDHYGSGSIMAQSSAWTIRATIERSLSSMPAREREALRAALLLYSEGLHNGNYNAYSEIRGLIYGDGKAAILSGSKASAGLNMSIDEALDWIVKGEGVDACISMTMTDLESALAKHPDNAALRPLKARLLGDGSDLDDHSHLAKAAWPDLPEAYLMVGKAKSPRDTLLGFTDDGSLITVAPPGSGKTQCHVIPNLLTWRGPAVVLDIKGEIYEKTSGWRAANVGPVYKFSPLKPEDSHAYNPLTGVSSDPDHIWEDARFIADMMIVPSGAKDPFWESKARDVLTAAVAHVAYRNPPEQRTMSDVLDILHGVAWDRFIISLQAATDVPTMARSGRSLGELETKTRDGVLQSALASLSAWEGARIARATARSDWQPGDLRAGQNSTVYICINPNEIDSYASLLRVIVAQHIRVLTAKLPEREGTPILFILDELPRLRRMPPVEEALEIGRQYGIKLWMFAQSVGQLETAYENADGMIGSCALRMFMNPSLYDETAQKLSEDMGYRESVIDGTRVKRVEPQVLAGPDFKDAVIVMASNAPPARVEKHFAHADPELAARMALPSVRKA
jgi:type IV secretion system protein VirD4